MQRLALLCVLVPAGAVLSGTPVTNPTIRNAVASLATLTPGGKWKTSCTGAFVDLDGLGNVWRNGTWWFAVTCEKGRPILRPGNSDPRSLLPTQTAI